MIHKNLNSTTNDFLELLVETTTGYKFDSIPDENKPEIIQKSLNMFTDFIVDYVQAEYSTKDAIRLKSAQKFTDDQIFSKFPDLVEKFDSAYDAFFNNSAQFTTAYAKS